LIEDNKGKGNVVELAAKKGRGKRVQRVGELVREACGRAGVRR